MYIVDNDDEHGDKYIMMKCVFVCHQKSLLPTSKLRRINLADMASFIKMNIFVEWIFGILKKNK